MSTEQKIEMYEKALDALIDLSEFEGGHLTETINRLRHKISEMQSDSE